MKKWKAFVRAWITVCVRAVPLEEVQGYREEYENRLAAYVEEIESEKERRRLAERERDRARAALQEPRWSDGAALGYAAMAAIDCGLTPCATVGLLGQMEGFLETVTLEAAAEYCQAMQEGGPPEWVGPGAELKPREPGTGEAPHPSAAPTPSPQGEGFGRGDGATDCHGPCGPSQ